MTFLAACYLAWPLAAWIYASATGQLPWGPAGQAWVSLGAAVDHAWRRWPAAPLYTYVDADRIRSPNPGYCFLAAGWRRLSARTAARGLRILVLEP